MTWYVVSGDNPTNPLLVIPGADAFTPGAGAIAQAMIDVGVADAIAQAILGTGLPLIPNPTILYNIAGTNPPPSGASLLGFTIPNMALVGNGCYDKGKTQAAADTQMVGILGRPSGTHPTFTKKFWTTVSDYTLPKNDMQNYANFGTVVATANKPSFVAGRPANTNFRTDPGITAAQRAQANTDFAAITAFYNTLLGAPYNFTPAQLINVFWQEPEVAGNGMSATDYQNVQFTYRAALPAGILNCADIGSGRGAASAISYANAAVASGVAIDMFAQDYYCPVYPNQTLDQGVATVADAQNKPFGIFEFGAAPNNFPAGTRVSQVTNYMHHIQTFMANRIAAGKQNAPCEYYMGQCDANGASDLTSPIGLDPTVAAPDFRIALYQQMYDAITSSAPQTGFTINPTSTVTITPETPSPIGGLCPADFLSYELAIGLTAGAASTNPFIAITLNWYDFDLPPSQQTAVYKEVWHIPMGTNGDPNGALIAYGGGRQHGAFLQVKINNQDTVACTVDFLQIVGTSRVGQRSSLVWYPNANNSPAVPGFTLAQCVDGGLQLGRQQSVVVAANTTNKYLCGLWGGQAFVRVLVSGGAAANTLHFQIQPQPTGVFGTEDIINTAMGIIGQNDERTYTIALPRCPCLVLFNNNDANAITCSFQIIGIETA